LPFLILIFLFTIKDKSIKTPRNHHVSKIISTANIITFFRIICTVLFVVFMTTEHKTAALVFFFIAGISDFFDGYIARLKGEETRLGAVLDPIADKFLLISATTILFFQQQTTVIPLWFLLLIVAKESIQIIGGIFLWYHAGMHAMLRPTLLSKWTTVSLLVFITCALISLFFNTLFPEFLTFLLILNTILLGGSFLLYILLFLKKFNI
jgi:cardiolipin synthase (CMP-forming)